MADLDDTAEWIPVTRLERTDPVDAGAAGDGKANMQAAQNAKRARFLFESMLGTGALHIVPADGDPSPRILTADEARQATVYASGGTRTNPYTIEFPTADAGEVKVRLIVCTMTGGVGVQFQDAAGHTPPSSVNAGEARLFAFTSEGIFEIGPAV